MPKLGRNMVYASTKVKGLLAGYRFDFSCESTLQQQLEQVLRSNDILFRREVVVSPKDRIDFLLDGGMGIEVKIQGAPSAIYRQCRRYCQSDLITSLLLVTGRSMGLPETIEGKDCHVLLLGRSWL